MIKIATFQRYIESCDLIINNSKDPNEAKELENEMVSVLGNYIKNIRKGLSRYKQRCFYGNETTNIDIDYIGDIRILRNKLQVELEKIMTENSKAISNIKSKKVLVSHASNDKLFVELFVNSLEDIGLSETEIVCSLIPRYGIPLGKDIYDWLSE